MNLSKIRGALVARCKSMIANNIKLEDAVNYAQFFHEAATEAGVHGAADGVEGADTTFRTQ